MIAITNPAMLLEKSSLNAGANVSNVNPNIAVQHNAIMKGRRRPSVDSHLKTINFEKQI